MTFLAVDRNNTNAVKLESSYAKFGTNDLLPLWVADMDIASPKCVQEAIINRAKHPIYGYTTYPKSYYKAIMGWIQRRFEWEVEREWIVPAHGVVSSINLCIEALSQLGDGVIVQTPIYPPFISAVQNQRRKLLENRLLYRNGNYNIDFEDFELKAKEAKLFLLCSPHNPTTRVWDIKELQRLVEICKREDVIIISDEIHSDIVYEKRHHILASLASDRTILLNAPSKTFNVAGLNSSYAIIADKKLRTAYVRAQRKSGLGNGNPFGIEALIAAYGGGDEWLDEVKKYLKNNIDFIAKFIKKHKLGIIPVKTEATFLIWLDCSRLGFDDEELETFFIKEAKLGLNSGISFGSAGSQFMRLNIATSLEVLEEAMGRLLDAYTKGKIQ